MASAIWCVSREEGGSWCLPNPPRTLIPVQMIMTDGMPYTIDYTLELQATSAANLGTTSRSPLSTAAYIDADFRQTLRWGGITSATDFFTGLPVPHYTLISASDFDYRNPVPEPGPGLLWMTAVLGLAASRKRRAN